MYRICTAQPDQDGLMHVLRIDNDASIVCEVVMEDDLEILPRIEQRKLTIIKVIKGLTLICPAYRGPTFEFFKGKAFELVRIEKSNNLLALAEMVEMYIQSYNFSDKVNSGLIRAIMSRCNVQQIAKSSRRGTIVDNMG